MGGGVDLVTAADCRYATVDAWFSVHEINIGMTADVGTLQRLPKLIPSGVAREYAYTGRRLPALRARELGLVNEVFDDHASMMEAVMAIASEIASKSPLAVHGTKEAINYSRDHTVEDSLRHIALAVGHVPSRRPGRVLRGPGRGSPARLRGSAGGAPRALSRSRGRCDQSLRIGL